MLVDRVVPIAHKRLATIGYDAPLLEAARLLGGSSDLVVVCGPDGLLKGVITKTDIVRQVGRCQGSTCQIAVSSVMTEDVVICRPTDWLHDVWSIWRLVPNSVSSGCTDRQLDLAPQSPQPSHTASLMTTRRAGSGYSPCLRRRRFSAAQV